MARKCMKCSRKATLFGTYNGAAGYWYYCTQHMKQARLKGFLQFIWAIAGRAAATPAQRKLILD